MCSWGSGRCGRRWRGESSDTAGRPSSGSRAGPSCCCNANAQPADLAPPGWVRNSPFPLVSVIGGDESTHGLVVLYADSRGVSRVYQMSLDDGVMEDVERRPGVLPAVSGGRGRAVPSAQARGHLRRDGRARPRQAVGRGQERWSPCERRAHADDSSRSRAVAIKAVRERESPGRRARRHLSRPAGAELTAARVGDCRRPEPGCPLARSKARACSTANLLILGSLTLCTVAGRA